MPKNSGFFGFVMINKNNSVESRALYREGLLKFFAALRMTTEHQITSAANQFFAGDTSLPQKNEMEPHQKALPQNLL
ncbi:hypothetical protein [Nostoc sp. LPT]|uniref:hypothetical protein n=1 Tax=Nostoc sp. LPT TaxID=2815387 RepID=UPI001DC00D2C|nr:hypothetical protein [Nostoc sp. LPT]MBN4001422.1 hypothetical protein [Nostoc sp. LPT]